MSRKIIFFRANKNYKNDKYYSINIYCWLLVTHLYRLLEMTVNITVNSINLFVEHWQTWASRLHSFSGISLFNSKQCLFVSLVWMGRQGTCFSVLKPKESNRQTKNCTFNPCIVIPLKSTRSGTHWPNLHCFLLSQNCFCCNKEKYQPRYFFVTNGTVIFFFTLGKKKKIQFLVFHSFWENN